MRRILFEQTDFASLPNPPAGFNYIGFNGATFSQKDDSGNTTQPGGGLVQLTYSESLDLLDAKGVKEGTRYLITGFDVDLYGGTDILVDGLPDSQFSSNGYGKFYNPNYNEYSTWDSTNTYNIDDIVIYGGKVWKNLTGSTGDTDGILGGVFGLDGTNWELQSDYTNTLHYVLVWDQIQIGWSDGDYCINSRFDSFRNNFVRIGQLDSYNNDRWFYCGVNPIAAFGWGNDSINDCTITDSYFNCLNIISSQIYGIKFDNYSYLFSVQIKDAYIESWSFTNESGFFAGSIENCDFTNINLDNNSSISFSNIYGGSFDHINLNNSEMNDFDVYNSYFNHINLDNSSSISYVSATNSSYYEFVNMTNDSWTDNFTLDNSSVRRIDLSNDSYIDEIYLNNNSYIRNLDIKNSSFQNHILHNDSFIESIYLNNSNFSNIGLSSSYISSINSFSSYISDLDLTNSDIGNMNVDRSQFSNLTKETGSLYQLDLNTFYLNLSIFGTNSNTLPSGSSFRFNEIKYQFELVMDGSNGRGLSNSSLAIPNMLIPSGYYIEKIILDNTSNLVATGALPDLSFGTFGETPSLLEFDLSTLDSVKIFDLNNQLTVNKANSDKKLYAELSGGTNITSGTITMEITLKKTKTYYD